MKEACPPPVYEQKKPFADKSSEREGWSPTSTKKLGVGKMKEAIDRMHGGTNF
jgi:hypothetical protein